MCRAEYPLPNPLSLHIAQLKQRIGALRSNQQCIEALYVRVGSLQAALYVRVAGLRVAALAQGEKYCVYAPD